MDVQLNEVLLAVVTTEKDSVLGSPVPVFYASNPEERERVALLLSKITKGMVHDLENGCYVIVKH